MATQNANLLVAGVKGTVLAINRTTGEEVWRTPLKGSDFVNLVIDNENIYASTKGEIFCLNAATGELRWHNKLSGLGFGLVTIATPSAGLIAPISEKRRREQAAVAAAAASAGS